MSRPTHEEVVSALVAANVFGIVAQRLAIDLFTRRNPADEETIGCVFDSGAGRCDGVYNHINKLHYSVRRNELWESPW